MLTMQVLGNLGGDPDVKTSQGGKQFCRLSVASNKKVRGEKVTSWVNVTIFDEHKIKFAQDYLKKGDRVFLEGEPQARAYESNGEARASLDMILGFGSKLEIAASEPRSDNGRRNAASSQRDNAGSQQSSDWNSNGNYDDLDDDIPF